MAQFQIHKAERRQAKLRLALCGVSGSGKTMGALQIAFGLGGKTLLIDTENGSGDLYAGLGEYDVMVLQAPFAPERYVEAIHAGEQAGYTTIIIDSLSHAWAGVGGALDKHGRIADSGKGNSWTAWRAVTPLHNALIDKILQSNAHIIATMRSHMEYVQSTENGKTEIKKVGLAPIQRQGIDFEFTTVLDLDGTHTATSTKDRTGLFDGKYEKITLDTGKKILAWLNQGSAVLPAQSVSDSDATPWTDDPKIFSQIKGRAYEGKTTPQWVLDNPDPIGQAKNVYPATEKQLKFIVQLCKKAHVKTKEEMPAYIKETTGLDYPSIGVVDKYMASRVIEALMTANGMEKKPFEGSPLHQGMKDKEQVIDLSLIPF